MMRVIVGTWLFFLALKELRRDIESDGDTTLDSNEDMLKEQTMKIPSRQVDDGLVLGA